ncbi:glycosyltransferase family 39 protein [Streptomyces sp. CBMA123]|uniref:glycosyltransferase family 39 protein n=1 Tax=Streptomyces sp. CBMA123 TaxID=1896313 RepID=UPI001661F096|nr:glycosyltransferase family 39 protein [Streptomyces sp. CBMA123]
MAINVLTAPGQTPAARPRGRRAPWTSPDGQPGYARPVLLGIATVAAVLYTWNINHSQYHTFYADAVRSMTESWKAFVFGSFDPAGTITLDKLPGFLWPQALSARVLGFHPWALTLPQVVEGVLSVLVMYRVVRRWAGADAGLLAAAAFTLTPVAAGLFRTAVEDAAFTLLLLLAADAAQRAAHAARLRPLLLAGVWVGLAFQTKMLEAWAVLPALAAVYLLAAPAGLRRRAGHVALAGLVTVVVSASWMLAVTVTPAQDRPYVDGTTDNSAFSMVVGYNFLNRFSSLGMSAAQTGSVQAVRVGGAKGPYTSQPTNPYQVTDTPRSPLAPAPSQSQGGGANDGGWTKMFGSRFAPQTGWLYPLAAVALACGPAWRRREPRTDVLRAGYVLWGAWLGVFFLVFSAGSVGGHSYYMGVIAAPLAALGGAGTVLLWQGFRAGGARAWALPAAIAGTVAWSARLAREFPAFLPWLAPTVIGLGAVALALLAAVALKRVTGRGFAPAGLLAGVAAMLVAPGAWASSVLSPAYGNSGMGTVGPSGGARHPMGSTAAVAAPRAQHGGGGFAGSSGHLTAPAQALFDYLRAHRDGARYLFAASDWSAAAPFILATGEEVLPMGGFSGSAPSPTLAEFRQLIRKGELRYVLLGTDHRGGDDSAGATTTAQVQSWVRSACTQVPATDVPGPAPTADGRQLYRCPRAD